MTVRNAFLTALLVAAPATAQLQCFSNPAGDSCGPQLVVTFVPNGTAGNYDMTMQGSGMHPRSLGIFVWGGNPVTVTLPGGCMLLTDYIWGHSFMTDAIGDASWSRSWPHWATITFYMQMGSVVFLPDGSYEARTTNCRLAGCL